ncbi:hypothetical protein MMC07_009537 [Pseudocyphellaria aurata]|nr:hypothetical protein [Pseudocyphellaria aurata]
MSVDSFASDRYGLGRAFSATVRLNLQHYLWKDVLGYNIHPNIPLCDKKDFCIADIGTGTGIWLIDVSRKLSAACLDGFDISTKQYPPQKWLPANVSLKSLDIYSSVPEELIEKYDIIHVRLFLCVINDGDPRTLLKNILKMLICLIAVPSDIDAWLQNPESTAIDHLVAWIKSGINSSYIPRLVEIYEELGFDNVSANNFPTKPELRGFFTQLQFMVSEEFSYGSLENSSPEADGPKLRKLIEEASHESSKGVNMDFGIQVAIGRKAM